MPGVGEEVGNGPRMSWPIQLSGIQGSWQTQRSIFFRWVCFTHLIRWIWWWPRLWKDGVTWLHWHGGSTLGRRTSESAGIRERTIWLFSRWYSQCCKTLSLANQTLHKSKDKLYTLNVEQPHQVDVFFFRSTWNNGANVLGYAYFPTHGGLHMNDAMKLAAGDYVTEVSVLSSCVTLV